MKTRDLSELAVRNLREAVLRNSLTTLGVAVGVASLVAMLSLGVGLQTLASQRLTRSGLFDAVFVTSQRNFRGPGDLPRHNQPQKRTSGPLTRTRVSNSASFPTSRKSIRKSASSPTCATQVSLKQLLFSAFLILRAPAALLKA